MAYQVLRSIEKPVWGYKWRLTATPGFVQIQRLNIADKGSKWRVAARWRADQYQELISPQIDRAQDDTSLGILFYDLSLRERRLRGNDVTQGCNRI